MANVHIKTAARDLRRAVSDINSDKSKVRAEYEDKKRSIDQQIEDIREKESHLKREVSNSQNSSQTAAITMRLSKLENDISDLEKKRNKLEDQKSKDLQGMEEEEAEIKQVSSRLESIA